MNILYTLTADQIEVGDQILVDGDPIEVTAIEDDADDNWAVVVKGFSHDTGDRETYSLPADYTVSVWAV
jgi:hypothetical protein